MSKKNFTFTQGETDFMNHHNGEIKEKLDALERAKQFKVGDYLILFTKRWHYDEYGVETTSWEVNENSYGAPIKYQCVAVSEIGIPFMKQITANGTVTGAIIPGLGNMEDADFVEENSQVRWELDPDYADSLILSDEYDPSQLHRNKKQIWKEVTEHNKSIKIQTKTIPDIIEFFKTLKVGDMIWTSNVSHYMVREIKTLSKNEALKIIGNSWTDRVKGPYVLVLNVVDKKGIVRDIAADFFFHKALYKDRPRTYKELNL